MNLVNPFWATAPFNPATYGTPLLWLKADAISGSDGDAIASWPYSTYGQNADQSNVSYKPILKTNILNGKPIVRFDGTDDFLEMASAITGTAFMLFSVFNNSASDSMLCGLPGAGANFQWRLKYGGAEKVSLYAGSSESVSSTLGTALSSFSVVVFSFGSTASFFQNGTAYGGSSCGGTHEIQSIGKSGVGVNIAGDIAELLLYDSQLSTGNRQPVEDYLGAKYGITITH